MSAVVQSRQMSDSTSSKKRKAFGGKVKLAGLAVAAAGLLGAGYQNGWFKPSGTSTTDSLLTYSVEPRDLPITVIERGSLESQVNVKVYCEVDDVRSDGINGTPIVWVIDNGASVSEGDLICELDSSAIRAELDEQILDTEEAKSSFIQAQANLENQSIENDTAIDKAVLDVQLATLDLEMFNDSTKGSHQLALEAIERQIDDLNNEILAAEMNLKLRRNEKTGIESLFKLGYAGKSEMDRSVLSYQQAEGDYAAKLNRLQTQQASLDKLRTFDKERQLLQLEGDLSTAKQRLEQVRVTNEAKMAQMKGVLSSRTEQLKKEEERLKRYQDQLAKCKIYAPQDGMIAYATSRRDEDITEGAAVRPRQHILSIPNLRQMQVRTSVHESVLDRIQNGLKATISIDAFPDRTYEATVKSVAVLPESSSYSDTKSYETIITLDEDAYQLKPGMTAVSEIKIDYLPEVKAIPLQAIVQREKRNWVYIKNGTEVARRDVLLGPSNEQYVTVTDGIEIGDQVVLNPAGLVERAENSPAAEVEPEQNDESVERLVAATGESAEIN